MNVWVAYRVALARSACPTASSTANGSNVSSCANAAKSCESASHKSTQTRQSSCSRYSDICSKGKFSRSNLPSRHTPLRTADLLSVMGSTVPPHRRARSRDGSRDTTHDGGVSVRRPRPNPDLELADLGRPVRPCHHADTGLAFAYRFAGQIN